MSMDSALRSPGCLSELALDEWLAGEGTPRDRAAWEAHAETCEVCQQRRRQRAEFNQNYLASARDLEVALERFEARGPAASQLSAGAAPGSPRARASAAPARARRPVWIAASGALALAASLLLFLALPRDGELAGSTRTKGQSRLDFYVKSGSSVRAGAPGERVLPGDALRFVVPRGESRYLVVLGRDSLGVTSVYFPAGPLGRRPLLDALDSPAAADALSGGLALDSSVVLDAAPGVERFYAVFCDAAQSTSEWRDELARSGRLAPRSGCEVSETSITKAVP
jgi:hypothetical protein